MYIYRVETFKYLGRIFYKSDNGWPEICQNFRKACQVWSRMGKLLSREGAEPRVSTMFFWAVVQAVLLFGTETWFLSKAMSWMMEGVNRRFLRQIIGPKAK